MVDQSWWGCRLACTDDSLVQHVMTFMKVSLGLSLTSYLQWPPLARLLGPKETDKDGFGKMLRAARQIIDDRFTKPLGRSDMIASFVKHGLSREDVLTEAMLQILAGSDTTATALRSTMPYLITHPHIFCKLRAEIDAVVSSGSVPSPPGIASDECLKSMPYLQAIVREGLRIHPPLSNVVPKKVPKGGDSIVLDGKTYILPEGTNIGYNVWGVHREKTMFGEDAEIFDLNDGS